MTGEIIILWMLGACVCVCAPLWAAVFVALAVSELRAIVRGWRE